MPSWLLVYVIVFDVGTPSIKEVRFDMRFDELIYCQKYALSNENKKYMQETYKSKKPIVKLVYPGCETESRAMYLDYINKNQGI